ncbi:MAG: TIGR02391 family protein [Oscillospiraceae bacterium]
MDINKINELSSKMRYLASRQNAINIQISTAEITNIRESILLIATSIEHSQPFLYNQLIGIKDILFVETRANWTTSCFYINPVSFGQGIAVLDILLAQKLSNQSDWCYLIHPRIAQVSKKLYFDGSYANAACDAFIEVNDRVKRLFQVIKPGEKVPDGDGAMKTVFSTNSPLIEFCDRSTDSGANTQKGFMEMLAGSMSALRNPKAHANIQIGQEDAMRRLIFASMLMYKIDEAVLYSKITEPLKSQ